MGCATAKPKRVTLLIIIDSPPPSLPSSMHIFDFAFNQFECPAAKLPLFEKQNQPVILSSQPTNEGRESQTE
ncbi:unnamed protein product [Paramecium sonneborni]|uniref:Uncharacterized protein n=1 Tax=Paramecium sonneborni TaxID=65129 RepID=A0A8S1PD99_9CILI|nr:unnamed protein product [Paramecium sonneborni]CAD8101049.1 unnamed protein product [Paramecium sonneborni]